MVRTAAITLVTLVGAVRADAESRLTDLPQSLPLQFIKELKEEGCIFDFTEPPRLSESNQPISGALANPDQTDWAALCTTKTSHSIRVHWGGPTACSARIDIDNPPDTYTTPAEYESERKIGLADKAYIVSHYESYGGQKPRQIDHLGINYIYVGKASVVYYCYEGKWVALSGAD